jgi:predicted nucleic acid-binding protein
MAVVDASALALAVLGTSPDHRLLRGRLSEETCHAPHIVDAEVGNVLRHQVLRGSLPAAEAEVLLGAAAALVDLRYGMSGTLGRVAWGMHQNLSFYDAVYVALAGALSLPLLTADARLSRAPGLPCAVELIS